MQTTLKFTPIVTNHPIYTFNRVSLLSITGSPKTIYYLTPIRQCSPPNSLPTTILPQMYLGHTLIHTSTTLTYLGIHINNKLTFDKHISTFKSSTVHHLFNIKNTSLHRNIHRTNYYLYFNSRLLYIDIKKVLRKSFFISMLLYCIPILLSSHNKYLQPSTA